MGGSGGLSNIESARAQYEDAADGLWDFAGSKNLL